MGEQARFYATGAGVGAPEEEDGERLPIDLTAEARARLESILTQAVAALAADGGLLRCTGVMDGRWQVGALPVAVVDVIDDPAAADSAQADIADGTLYRSRFGQGEEPAGELALWYAGPPCVTASDIAFHAALAGDLLAAAWGREAVIAERARSERSGRAKDEFLSLMSHELRTPLNAILGFSEVLRDQLLGPLGTLTYIGYAGDIHRAGSYLLALINDLLDLSKIEAGKYEVIMKPINLTELVESSVKVIEPLAEKKSIPLVVDLRCDLCLGDERAIQQILVNLLSNSIKFSEPEMAIHIESTATADNHVVLSVADQGIGMTEEEVKIALKPFGQLHSAKTKTNQQGTGLGLPLVQRLAQLMGGRMEIDSEKNIGTRISIALPAFMPMLFR